MWASGPQQPLAVGIPVLGCLSPLPRVEGGKPGPGFLRTLAGWGWGQRPGLLPASRAIYMEGVLGGPGRLVQGEPTLRTARKQTCLSSRGVMEMLFLWKWIVHTPWPSL